VIAGTLTRFLGASGVMSIIAPLPASEVPELPITFYARTVAKTLEPQGRLYGETVRAVTGTRHDEALTTPAEAPLHNDVAV